jgi:hypothetical protein
MRMGFIGPWGREGPEKVVATGLGGSSASVDVRLRGRRAFVLRRWGTGTTGNLYSIKPCLLRHYIVHLRLAKGTDLRLHQLDLILHIVLFLGLGSDVDGEDILVLALEEVGGDSVAIASVPSVVTLRLPVVIHSLAKIVARDVARNVATVRKS